MRVPGIYIDIKGNVDQLRADLSTMQRMVRESSGQMSDAMNNALTPTQIEEGYRRLVGALSSLTTASRATSQGVKAMNVELGDLQHRVGVTAEKWTELQNRMLDTRRIKAAEDAFRRLKQSINMNDVEALDFAKAFGLSGTSATAYGAAVKSSTAGAMSNIAILAESANLSKERIAALQSQASKGVDVKVRTQALQGLADQIGLSRWEIRALEKEAGVSLDRTERGFKSLAAAFSNIALYGGIYSAAALVQQLGAAAVRAAMDMDKLRLTLEGVYGDRAGAEGQYIADFADKYGKGIVETSQSYIKFAAAAEYVGVSIKDVRQIFESTTQAITKVGGSTQDVSGALVALGQMLSKGTVSAEEFRLQFGERIPGAMKMGADAMGVTVAEFKKLMETGQLVSTEFLPKLAVQLKTFGQGWEKAAGSIESSIQRMKNQFALLAEALLSLDEAKAGVSGLAEAMAGLRKMAESYATMQKLVDAYRSGKLSLDQFAEAGGLAYEVLGAMGSQSNLGAVGKGVVAALIGDMEKAKSLLAQVAEGDQLRTASLVAEYKVLAESHRYITENGDAFDDAAARASTFERAIGNVVAELTRIKGEDFVIRLRTEFESPFQTSLRDLNMTEKQLAGVQDIFSRASSRPLSEDSKFILEQRDALGKAKRQEWLKEQYGLGKIDGDVLVGAALKSLNTSIQQALGKKYTWGGTSLSGGFDCSGLVEWGYTGLADSLGKELESFGVKPEEFKKLFAGATSDKIFTNVKEFVGKSFESRAEDFNAAWIKAGTILATDNGQKSYDKGRYGGIDHIAMAVWDEVEQKLKVVEAVGGNVDKVISTEASAWLAQQKKKGTEIYAVNPMEKLGLKGESLADYQRYADGIRSIQERLTADNIRLTQGEFAARRQEVESYVATVRESDGYIMASAEKRQEIEADLATYKAAKLDEIAKAEQEAAQQAIDAQRRVSEETAQLMESLGLTTGNMGLQRQGLLAQIQAEALATEEALKRANLPAQELAQLLADLKVATDIKSRDAKMETASSFDEWWSLANQGPRSYFDQKRADEEKQVWSGVADHYIETTQLMSGAREAFYDAVIAKAQATGNAELSAIAQVAKEAEALQRLQAIQEYGDPTAAFLARLSEKLGEFKSEAAKAREAALEFANSLIEIKNEAAAAIGQLGGDLVYGFITGQTGTMEEAFAELGDTAARAFSDKFAEMLEDYMNDVFDWLISELKNALSSLNSSGGGVFSGILSSLFGALGGGLFSSGNVNTSALINAPIVAKAKGDVMGAPGLSAYRNSIVSSPTFFPFAKGAPFRIGLMGEAGPEAIMPLVDAGGGYSVRALLPDGTETSVDLTRTASGHLGVDLSGIELAGVPSGMWDVVKSRAETAVDSVAADWFSSINTLGAGVGGWDVNADKSSVISQPTAFAFAKGGVFGGDGAASAPLQPVVQMPQVGGGGVVAAPAPQVSVTVNEAPGTKARVTQDNSGNITVQVEQLENLIASRVNRGVGPLSSMFRGGRK